MPLKREKEIPIPEFAHKFIEDMNRDRLRRGDLPLSEEQIQRIVDKLKELKENV